MISLQDYYRDLQKFDWYYNLSDSSKVYQAGDHEYRRLVGVASLGPPFEELFQKFFNYVFKAGPKPERPE